jgi:hypothetical protein
VLSGRFTDVPQVFTASFTRVNHRPEDGSSRQYLTLQQAVHTVTTVQTPQPRPADVNVSLNQRCK